MSDKKLTASYKEVKLVIPSTTSEKDLSKTLEQLAINRAIAELAARPTIPSI